MPTKETTGPRALGAGEKALIGYARFEGNWRVSLTLTVALPKDENLAGLRDKVEAVLGSLRARHAVLRFRVVGKSNKDSAFRSAKIVDDEEYRTPVIVLEEAVDSWQDAWKTQFNKPLKWGDGVSRVVLAKKKSKEQGGVASEAFIVLYVEHAFSDGMSLPNLMNEIMLGLGSEDDKAIFDNLVQNHPLPYSNSMESYIRKATGPRKLIISGFRYFVDACRESHLDKVGVKVSKPFQSRSSASLSDQVTMRAGEEANDQEQLSVVLSSEDTKALLRRCRAEDTTITGVIGAAMMEAWREVLMNRTVIVENDDGSKGITILCAADARRFYKPPLASENVAMHSCFLSPYVGLTKDGSMVVEELWESARKYKEGIVVSTKSNYPMVLGRAMGYGLGVTIRRGLLPLHLKPSSVFLTNWARLPIRESYGSYAVIDTHPCATTTAFVIPLVIVSTWKGAIKLTLQMPHRLPDAREEGQQYAQGMLVRLQLLARSSPAL